GSPLFGCRSREARNSPAMSAWVLKTGSCSAIDPPRQGEGDRPREGGGGSPPAPRQEENPLRQRFALPPPRPGEDLRAAHQKYPSCFFFSIPAPPASLSIARPCRSLVVVSSISCTTSGSVAAVLSIAPVSG